MQDFLSIIFIFLALCGAQCRAQQNCDYYSTSNCLNVEASASVSLPFPSLFKEPPSFVYGIDKLTADDFKTIATRPRLYSDPVTFPSTLNGKEGLATGWWVEYDSSTVAVAEEPREYYVFALETYEGGKAGGSENGCEGVLGSDCVANLKSFLTALPINSYGFIGVLIENYADRPLRNLSCPRDIWGKEDRTSFERSAVRNLLPNQLFAPETPYSSDIRPLPSGNASSMNVDQALRTNTFDQQSSAGIVAVAMSWPSESENQTMDTVEVNMACLQVSSSSGTGGAPSGDDADNDAAAVQHVVWRVIAVALCTFVCLTFAPLM